MKLIDVEIELALERRRKKEERENKKKHTLHNTQTCRLVSSAGVFGTEITYRIRHQEELGSKHTHTQKESKMAIRWRPEKWNETKKNRKKKENRKKKGKREEGSAGTYRSKSTALGLERQGVSERHFANHLGLDGGGAS